ncbi:MAG: hydrogenase expression/formation protein HypE [Alphaproteobacteria bacterium]|nr:hydrogenase expression/formation protein HypE [Alphaproteobacteria bacterium]
MDAAHGGGGRASRVLLESVIAPALGTEIIEDQARLSLDLAGGRLAFTTDSYVVTPLFFPGGDIGALAVNGTVNDLAVGGARPVALSLGLVLEEGLEVDLLRRVLESAGRAARAAGVAIVTGDTKVVPRGAADRMFVNTSGVGVIPAGVDVSARNLRPGDALLVNGPLGDHGAAILVARGELALDAPIPSDTCALNGLTEALLAEVEVHAMRDLTRGGLAAALDELARASGVGVVLEEAAIPARPAVRGFCEVLGLDPVHLANEGRLVVAVPSAQADRALAILHGHPAGQGAAIIGHVRHEHPGVVAVTTGFGGERILDVLVGAPLPRIC